MSSMKEGDVIVVNRSNDGLFWITWGEFPDATPRGATHRKTKQCYLDVELSIPDPKEVAKVFFRDVYRVTDFTKTELAFMRIRGLLGEDQRFHPKTYPWVRIHRENVPEDIIHNCNTRNTLKPPPESPKKLTREEVQKVWKYGGIGTDCCVFVGDSNNQTAGYSMGRRDEKAPRCKQGLRCGE